jgi:enterochelin esterase family protein
MEAALPMVEKMYRVKEGRENRAIAGLSMGGLHSLTIGLNELETFSHIGAFSAAVPTPEAVSEAFEDGEKTNEQLKLFWIAIGKDDFLLEENKKTIAALDEAGIKYDYTLTEGGHSWPIWRDYLAEFAPLLFQ